MEQTEIYQVWTYKEPCFEISEHVKIADGQSFAAAETMCKDLSDEALLEFIDNENGVFQEYYIRKRDEPTYILYLVKSDNGQEKSNFLGVYYSDVTVNKKINTYREILDHYKIGGYIKVETRDDSDVRVNLRDIIVDSDDSDTDGEQPDTTDLELAILLEMMMNEE